MRIWYLPLEPYRERYTEQLLHWTEAAFRRNGVEYEIIHGQPLAGAERISVGPVLDARGRCYYALTQMAQLSARSTDIAKDDWLFVEDMFTPGYEAIPYIFSQLGRRPRIATRCYAQSVDPDDFTFAMRDWMRHYEVMVDETADVIFVASTCHKEMLLAAGLGRGTSICVVGLPFDLAQVRAQGPATVRPWEFRPPRVVYASRLDREKQPHLFMDAVEEFTGTGMEFVVCTGADAPRSNDPTVVPRLKALEAGGHLRVMAGLTKAQYYAELAEARVQLNTARQDFVSFTAIEASAFGVPTLAPAFRSFPEALENRDSQLYAPWVLRDLKFKLIDLLHDGERQCGRLADFSHGTLGRMLTVMVGHGE